MTGRLAVSGSGRGRPEQLTAEARAAVAAATRPLRLRALPRPAGARADQTAHRLGQPRGAGAGAGGAGAGGGRAGVAVVSGGDPGVFAMAAAVCEAIDGGPAEWRRLEVAVVPGVTAMLAVAARCGAPLGHDFCALSLSDNLKPWAVVEARLRAAAAAGFVIALYNPISRARPWQLGRAFEVLRESLPPRDAR